jgi:hypothetical protein
MVMIYIIVGTGGEILSSTDGIIWTKRNSGTGMKLFSVIWGEDRFIIVGKDGMILSSRDGIEWDIIDSGTKSALYKVILDGKYFIAVGKGIILISSDGMIWTEKEAPYIESFIVGVGKYYYNLADIFCDGEQYIAVRSGNFVLCSKDLEEWTVKVPHTSGNGMFCDLEWNKER